MTDTIEEAIKKGVAEVAAEFVQVIEEGIREFTDFAPTPPQQLAELKRRLGDAMSVWVASFVRPILEQTEARLAATENVARGMASAGLSAPAGAAGAIEWQIIEALRAEEGHSVTVVCDNPDPGDQPNNKVLCCGDWTGWKDREFDGDTPLDALKAAYRKMTGRDFVSSSSPSQETGDEFATRLRDRFDRAVDKFFREQIIVRGETIFLQPDEKEAAVVFFARELHALEAAPSQGPQADENAGIPG